MATTTMHIINVTVDCDCFIVPNKASKADLEFFMGRDLADKTLEIAEMNNFEYDPETDKFVQMWWTNENSKNFQDHGFTVTVGETVYNFHYARDCNYIPAKFFEGHKEGEILPLTIRMKPDSSYSADETIDRHTRRANSMWYDENPELAPYFEITFNLKLNQHDYRYARFGNFEDVLWNVSH